MKKLLLSLIGILCSMSMWAQGTAFTAGIVRTVDGTTIGARTVSSDLPSGFTVTDVTTNAKISKIDLKSKSKDNAATQYTCATADRNLDPNDNNAAVKTEKESFYIGFNIVVPSGKKLNLSSIDASTFYGQGKTFNYKMAVYKNGNQVYVDGTATSGNPQSSSLNKTLDTSSKEELQGLTGTVSVRMLWWVDSSSTYWAMENFTASGEYADDIRPASSKCDLTKLVLSNGCNTAIVGTDVTGYYMQGESVPTVSNAITSDYASYEINGNTLTVTAEDGTTTNDYTLAINEVAPLTSLDEQTITATTPSWLKMGVWNNGKSSHEIYKSVDQSGNMRITAGKNRAYLFVGPCDAVILTNSSSSENADCTGTYSVNGAAPVNVTWPKYNGGAVTITIPCSTSGNNMIEIVNTSTSDSWGFDKAQLIIYPTVTFSCTDLDVVGRTPVSQKISSATFSIPANVTLYKEGYTLTAWNDGSEDYAIGATYNVSGDVTLTPVFTQNIVNLGERNDDVIVKWEGNTYSALNSFTYQGNSGVYVTQATVNGETIDVAMQVDATSGKFGNNSNKWCQCNNGTVLTIYSVNGAAVEMKVYNPISTTTIGGDVPSFTGTTGNVIATYTASADGNLSIVAGDDISWLGYLQITLPANKPTINPSIVGSADKAYATYCSATNFTATAGTIFKGAVSNDVVALTCVNPTGSEIIPATAGVIIATDGSSSVDVTYTATAATADMAGNALIGTTSRITTPVNCMALNATAGEFQSYTGAYFPANKAYLVNAASAKNMRVVFGNATGIKTVNAEKVANAKFIENGRIVIVKDGAKYNVAGQVIK